MTGYVDIPLPLPQPGDTFVYVIENDYGEVLYVGMSTNWAKRIGEHHKAAWWQDAKWASVRQMPNREAASREEYRLIHLHQPVGNVAGAKRRGVVRTAAEVMANQRALEAVRALGPDMLDV